MGATLFIDRRGAHLDRDGQALLLRLPDAPPRRVPLRGLDRIILHGSARIEAGALNLAWQQGIALLCLTGRHGEAGARFHGRPHADAAIRLAQYRVWGDAALRLHWARELTDFRIDQMRAVATRIARTRRGGARRLEGAMQAMRRARDSVAQAPDLDSLRGAEGALQAAWFRALAPLFPPSLGFSARRRRPPPDPVNAVLSLGYTLATAEAGRAIVRAGMDPAIGLIHGIAHGRESLALDLVEPARPLVDELAHRLFHDRVLEARHFSRVETTAAVLLGKAGRRAFYEAWEAQAAPRIRTLMRLLAREAVRRLRAHGPGSPFGGAPLAQTTEGEDDIAF